MTYKTSMLLLSVYTDHLEETGLDYDYIVRYLPTGTSASTLTPGMLYRMNDKGRICNDKGRWSKYGLDAFILEQEEAEVYHECVDLLGHIYDDIYEYHQYMLGIGGMTEESIETCFEFTTTIMGMRYFVVYVYEGETIDATPNEWLANLPNSQYMAMVDLMNKSGFRVAKEVVSIGDGIGTGMDADFRRAIYELLGGRMAVLDSLQEWGMHVGYPFLPLEYNKDEPSKVMGLSLRGTESLKDHDDITWFNMYLRDESSEETIKTDDMGYKDKGEDVEVKVDFDKKHATVTDSTKKAKPVSKEPKKQSIKDFLLGQGVPKELLVKLVKFRREYQDENLPEDILSRIEKPDTLFLGGKIWTQALGALLAGKSIILEGHKATGKNILANNLSWLMNRPQWDVSFHSDIDVYSLVGSETYKDGEVKFNPGMVYQCAEYGGVGVLDEINMARSEAVAMLHATLDSRRVLDVPGHGRKKLHPATRFIGTMNYGYTGTRELNEALVSRFVVIHLEQPERKQIKRIIAAKKPNANNELLNALSGIYVDLQRSAEDGKISTRAVDLRGLISVVDLIENYIPIKESLEICIKYKAFDNFERDIIKDVIETNITESWSRHMLLKESE